VTSSVTAERRSEADLPTVFGFRVGNRGTMTSRTIMLSDLTTLLAAGTASASKANRWSVIIDGNLLGKKTASTRKLTAQRLSELYALDPSVTLFRLLQFFWEIDPVGRPLLAMLCANARDPLLRMTAGPILQARQGDIVSKEQLEDVVSQEADSRFNKAILNKIARNAASSWTQSEHLSGRYVKRRSSPKVTAANTAYALVLGYLCGFRGALLFHTFWSFLLDAPEQALQGYAREASSRGWLTYRGIGNVIDISFSEILTAKEMGILNG
jgi:hypothetical protein